MCSPSGPLPNNIDLQAAGLVSHANASPPSSSKAPCTNDACSQAGAFTGASSETPPTTVGAISWLRASTPLSCTTWITIPMHSKKQQQFTAARPAKK
mmetsp:Transcript_28847/g.52538  ORF Transcript_28847/g.52538 Transcript_28847/m.52538 type:complete len:97 (-) Transcript_28847:588-878(-)